MMIHVRIPRNHASSARARLDALPWKMYCAHVVMINNTYLLEDFRRPCVCLLSLGRCRVSHFALLLFLLFAHHNKNKVPIHNVLSLITHSVGWNVQARKNGLASYMLIKDREKLTGLLSVLLRLFLPFLIWLFSALESSGFNNSKLQSNSLETLMTAPQLSNSPQ